MNPRRPHRVHLSLATAPTEQDAPASVSSALLVLVPGPFGGLQVFQRAGGGRLSRGPVLADAQHLCDIARRAHYPTVVLCGARHQQAVIDAVFGLADLFVVPRAWLRYVPRDDIDQIAALAARLVTAHRKRPIQRLYRWDQMRFPF